MICLKTLIYKALSVALSYIGNDHVNIFLPWLGSLFGREHQKSRLRPFLNVRLIPTLFNTHLAPVLAQMQVPAIITDSVPVVSPTFERAGIPKEIWDTSP